MAYLGTPPRSRVLSSADIDPGSISLDDISFTDQPTNLNLTGTYDKHTMRLADGVTVVGDVTISDNLILSKISDDGNAITLTNDTSTRTITGSGSLEASTLTQTPNASLTGMTGELGTGATLGSAVTGSPNLNLGNATFPTGHVIKTENTRFSGSVYTTTTSWTSSPFKASTSITFTPTLASSDILLIATFMSYTAATYGYYDFYKNASDVTETYNLSGVTYGISVGHDKWQGQTMVYLDTVPENSTSEKTYTISARAHNAYNTYIGFDAGSSMQSITCMEIAR
tara:strand:- start:1289 stop:2140 length:852 start_codon:yes stop_codon:yes gene_type:complete